MKKFLEHLKQFSENEEEDLVINFNIFDVIGFSIIAVLIFSALYLIS